MAREGQEKESEGKGKERSFVLWLKHFIPLFLPSNGKLFKDTVELLKVTLSFPFPAPLSLSLPSLPFVY